MSSFNQMTVSFFDELGNMELEKRRKKEDGMDLREDRPFSSLLTQDEEPISDGNPATLEIEEPEVVTRGTA
jgi:hypothetical protein